MIKLLKEWLFSKIFRLPYRDRRAHSYISKLKKKKQIPQFTCLYQNELQF